MSCGDVLSSAKPTQPSSTYEWLCTIPMAASAGSAVFSLYEGSKNYNCVTQYAVGTVESSVKKVASTVSPVVQKFNGPNGPIQLIDSYAASKLVHLGEKIPALKCETLEVKTYLSESKESLATKITEGRAAIATRLTDGKEAFYSNISAGSEAVCKSRAGVLVGGVKEALNTGLVQGKETLGSGVTAGYDAVYSRIQSGAECLANTRAGAMVGDGIDYTLGATECWVEYLIPELENEKEFFSELEKQEKRTISLPLTRQPKDTVSAADADDMEEEGDVKCLSNESGANRLERVHMISRKMKLRMYHRSMQRLHAMQHKCKATLEQLKDAVDLLQMAHTARDGLDKQYLFVTTTLKDLEEQVRQLLSRHDATREIGFNWLPKDGVEEDKIDWLTPRSQGTLQDSLDYARKLSEKVFDTFKSVSVATAYLPKQLKDGAGVSYKHAKEMYSTLKPIKTPMDLSASALEKIMSLLETQHRYVTKLGDYLSSMLKKGTSESLPSEDISEGDSGSDVNSGLAESESTDDDSVKI